MPRRILQGQVVSAKPDKTIIVKVERKFKHPLYQKTIKRARKYAVHDPNNLYNEGDRVTIIESRPVSKTKCWLVLEGKEEN
ncbi:30S ribosomal protein S17 [Orientia chuto str. Dubai]|uniref:Small ribosomal subunit protein uS17 n=1 Tax=Orientia chuto str. Dubai TaxID=1359168 RepID=A0A0F3MHL2_9RICK|nr:30S ribosomal protein S17 [Candidatus Orientia mediorientalis]KJV55253.1 30S ribosomal protein S17 [Orientia chuto str. Dubai]